MKGCGEFISSSDKETKSAMYCDVQGIKSFTQ